MPPWTWMFSLAHASYAFGGTDPGSRRGDGQLRRTSAQCPGAVVAIGACQFHCDVEIRQPVLDRLEGADRAAERVAFACIVARHLQRRFGAPQLLEGKQHRGPVEGLFDGRPTTAERAERLTRRCIERHPREISRRVDTRYRLHVEPARALLDDEQTHLICVGSSTCGDDHALRSKSVAHRNLRPGDPPASHTRVDASRSDGPGGFRQRQSADELAGGHPGQQALLLRR